MTHMAKASWVIVTSHEISHVTETHDYTCTRMGLPRKRRVVCEGYAVKRLAARADVLG
jgi:hypothetical protein